MWSRSNFVARSLLLLVSLAVFAHAFSIPSLERPAGLLVRRGGSSYGNGKKCAPLGAPWSFHKNRYGYYKRNALAEDMSQAEASPLEKRSTPITRLDAFYEYKYDLECQAPGTILKHRKIASAFFRDANVTAYELLYRTTAINGKAIATVTTIFVPPNALRDRFVSFHTAYDSSDVQCGPSYNYILNGTGNNGIVSEETQIINLYLQRGYIISSPDYEGPEAAFAAGRLEGMAVLDSMRAVSAFKSLKFTKKKPAIAGVGYSGGAIATGWAAQLQGKYAPELPVKGWAAGGTPANLTGTLVFDDNTTNSGFLPIAVVGLSRPTAYGCYLTPIIDRIATAEGKEVLAFAGENCAGAVLANFSQKSILSTEFQSLGVGLLTDKTITTVLADTLMGQKKREAPVAPFFLFHGIQDDTIPYANASTLNDNWCKYGASVNFTSFRTGGHVDVAIKGIFYAIDFVASAFEGTVKKGCSTTLKD